MLLLATAGLTSPHHFSHDRHYQTMRGQKRWSGQNGILFCHPFCHKNLRDWRGLGQNGGISLILVLVAAAEADGPCVFLDPIGAAMPRLTEYDEMTETKKFPS